MQVWLYRRRLSVLSGAGQLVQMQAEGLERAGHRPLLAASRRRLKFFMRTGRRVRSLTHDRAREIAASSDTVFVDHAPAIPEADIVFVHNLAAPAGRFTGDADTDRIAAEQRLFAALAPDSRIIANSRGVREALVADYQVSGDQVEVLHPGYRAARFNPGRRDKLRRLGRSRLGIPDDVPLIGLVSSGNLRKRGIDTFLAAASLIAEEDSTARFLVVGSSGMPAAIAEHELMRQQRLVYQPRSAKPELSYAAIDLFLYPARWEEFGMVVIEAMASGLPVLTSRRVGAAECLPSVYDDWTLAAPEAEKLATACLRLMADPRAVSLLVAAGLARSADLDDRRYGDRAASLILNGAV